MESFHRPVMLEAVVASLGCRKGGIWVDGTLGGAGHAEAILKSTAPDGRLIGIDADADALEAARRRLDPFGERKILVRGNFADMEEILTSLNIAKIDGVLLDLGVSSHQLDTASRGFSFALEGPLDMRMDQGRGPSASDLIQTLPEGEIERILRQYGEERMAGRIARAIVARRASGPIRTTTDLAAVVLKAMPRSASRQKIHPATRTFQALRIAVNGELENLREALTSGTERLRTGGRFSVISFHSLEDRVVKAFFRDGEKGCLCPPTLPICACGRRPTLRVLTKKPVTPTEAEIADNPRARSAKLRSAERI
ncbi:MAG: 16S rRNA (cytosine(1402)-N(4))-methyltransferase RsmH [Deltaproteobacteria bacterium]|nr:16S rRNA (cytosine(1402)-N(4))-methyltransferase RsmH [Deltaproteobacteria bacterium]